MRGTRRIVLMEPAPTGEEGAFGGPRQGQRIPHVVYAIQEPAAGGGDEGLVTRDVLGAETRRTYRIPEDAIPRSRLVRGERQRIVLSERWKVVDELGQTLDVESVEEANTGPRRRWLRIQCKRTQPRGTQT